MQVKEVNVWWPVIIWALTVAGATGGFLAADREQDRRIEALEETDSDHEVRLRTAETGLATINANLKAIGESIDELKQGQRETNQLLRDITKGRTR